MASSNFQMDEVILWRTTKDTTKALTTLGIKHVFKKNVKIEEEIYIMRRYNDVFMGYVWDVVGPIDPTHPEITIKPTLEKQALASTPLDSFLQACQNWRQGFENSGVEIV